MLSVLLFLPLNSQRFPNRCWRRFKFCSCGQRPDSHGSIQGFIYVYYDKTSDTTHWIWNDIILKTSAPDIEMLDKAPWIKKKDPYGKIAVSVDLNPKFKKDTFKLPEGIEIY